ncbi:ATP-binding cassette domain-containing protein [Frisingicoccus sp.]|uniref:ATP-binding cassette domain-containing protein n=1 Tax=Frisingicoccus sp. TaxID=1918627 RepID=UPI003AB426F5
MDIITLEHVTKSFNGQEILRDFSLSVKEGEFLTVIGRSGCGKTTMLKLMNGLLMPDEGAVCVEGKNIAETDIISLRRRIGYVIQNRGLFPHMTVEKNITYVPVISGKKDKKENRELALRLLKLVGLEEEKLEKYPAELSGGQQQRVGIARALAADPKILLMDEPFGALDEITRQTMQDEILKLQKSLKLTVVFITHDIREAMKLGDRVMVMEDGRVVQLDTPENICRVPADSFVADLIKSVLNRS